MIRQRHAKHGARSASVSIHVRDLVQMFNSLDPSPFWDRDLDRAAAEFVEGEFSEKRSAGVWHLYVHTHGGAASAADLQAAIENYYGRLASSARRALREHLWLLCMAARGIIRGTLGGLPQVLDQGLIILAWLALWRPAEALGYECVPLYRKRRLFQRLAGIRVFVRGDASATAESAPAPVS
jgi:hypothetical protein